MRREPHFPAVEYSLFGLTNIDLSRVTRNADFSDKREAVPLRH